MLIGADLEVDKARCACIEFEGEAMLKFGNEWIDCCDELLAFDRLCITECGEELLLTALVDDDCLPTEAEAL